MDITKDSHSIYTDIHIRIYTDYSDVHTDTSPRICLITDDNINYGQNFEGNCSYYHQNIHKVSKKQKRKSSPHYRNFHAHI